ncbi:acetyl-CoA carboxylase biotin carboxyl carrier protein [Bombilactobacillus thymidiniphilus]|uniref:Biotin carboxyl carrier protein of acetyl-CoA carboxylase n=1 Tax=Bombilactobacillus thymidiniphilus TaxID=2923363 RepID=A0ABY4PF71_9LACO|nr:acetyl-CoA carboxylase biotin carboxyl carrier protein [Bombilactobacillus thymidiniphilus]UQS84225.1 acetyl-CoA carboxylase biotin carboxyl carrier protein [Bombilactobacillus thymidiniphilus]
MTFAEIKALIEQINQSEIHEFDLDFDGGHLHLSKQDIATIQQSVPAAQPAVAATQVSTKNDDQGQTPTIKAPLVGIVYLQSAPDQPPFKKVGDQVQKGDVICVIEAMKMMTEVKSEISGTISEILVSDEEVVEYDQPLMKVTQS